jgi:hypothetical protein
VRLAQRRGLADDAREVAEDRQQRGLGLVGQQRRVEAVLRSTPSSAARRATFAVRAWAYWT